MWYPRLEFPPSPTCHPQLLGYRTMYMWADMQLPVSQLWKSRDPMLAGEMLTTAHLTPLNRLSAGGVMTEMTVTCKGTQQLARQ